MRDYAVLSPTFWTGTTGKRIRALGTEAQVLAVYLLSAPGSNMLGLFYLAIPTICHETGLAPEAVENALAALERIGFAEYDAESEHVWVYEMARWQILGRGGELTPRDKRVKGLNKELQRLSRNPFTEQFREKYASALCLEGASESGNPSGKPLPGVESVAEAPSRSESNPGRGSEGASALKANPGRANAKSPQEQEQEQEQRTEAGAGEGSGRPRGRARPGADRPALGTVPDPDPPPDDPPPPQALIALFRELRLQIRPKLGHYVGSTADDEAATRLLRVLSQLHGWVEGMALFRKVAGTYIRESRSTTPTFGKLEHDFDYWREQTTTDPTAGPDPTRYGDPDSQRERNQRLLADAAEATQETTP